MSAIPIVTAKSLTVYELSVGEVVIGKFQVIGRWNGLMELKQIDGQQRGQLIAMPTTEAVPDVFGEILPHLFGFESRLVVLQASSEILKHFKPKPPPPEEPRP